MNFYDTSWQIADLLDEGTSSVYLRTEPEVPDFTAADSFKIYVWNQRAGGEIDAAPDNIMRIGALFDETIFNRERVERLYVWNLKSFVAYHYFFVRKFVTPTNSVIDLKIIENFLGLKNTWPKNLIEAINRTKKIARHKNWQRLYLPIHQPLSLRVLPSIETTPLLNDETRKCHYPYYEIEGQINGRMNCYNKYAKSYIPHRMGADIKAVLKPRGYGLRFMVADFRHHEVGILQWLSGDENIKRIMDSGEDFYRVFYQEITGDPCNTEKKRAIAKSMFLPVMYGLGPKGLAKALGLAEATGVELYGRIKERFPQAMRWMWEKQQEAKQGIVLDYFGRPRKFEEGKPYLVRNFVVQGVAATACQEKLIEMYRTFDGESIRLAFSVHDGYGIICTVNAARDAYQTVKRVLESESKLCPGLKMKVEVKFGGKLDSMKELWRD
jgi:hypothetical protein